MIKMTAIDLVKKKINEKKNQNTLNIISLCSATISCRVSFVLLRRMKSKIQWRINLKAWKQSSHETGFNAAAAWTCLGPGDPVGLNLLYSPTTSSCSCRSSRSFHLRLQSWAAPPPVLTAAKQLIAPRLLTKTKHLLWFSTEDCWTAVCTIWTVNINFWHLV